MRAGHKVDPRLANRIRTQKEHAALVNESTLTDLKKALWYLERRIQQLQQIKSQEKDNSK